MLYTPANEHFGIVPVEAMHLGCVVIACNSGGPLESIADEETGFLRKPEAAIWAKQIAKIAKGFTKLQDKQADPKEGELVEELDIKQIIKLGQDRVMRMFSEKAFGDRLAEVVESMNSQTERAKSD